MARRALSRTALFVLAAALVASCAKDPELIERPLFVYSPRACAVVESAAFSVVYASGDFEPERTPFSSVFLRDVGRALPELPKETRSLVIDISQGDTGWRGVGDIPQRGPINVLVWPGAQTCRLTTNVERRTKMAVGVAGSRIVVVGGESVDGSQVPHTFVGDLRTGAVSPLAFGLSTRRSWPTVTAFGKAGTDDGAALVAGGEDPANGNALASAELYVPGADGAIGDFDRQRIDLSEARTQHGAVVLATGETLLVGGVGPAGQPLRTLEIVDPGTRRARTAGLALLQVGRRNPSVLRLASGEILVAGGLDPDGNEVPTLEWLAADASRPTKRPVDLVTGRERALVPLDSGGALAVIAPRDPNPDFRTVWVISADGTLEPAAPVDPTTLDVVRLFQGSLGAPVLWTGQRWLRWAPWLGAFQSIGASAPETGPPLDAITNGDPGLALWLDDRDAEGMHITGYRFATRTRFDAIPKPLLVTGPDWLAPDRLAGNPTSSVRFDSERGLLLGAGASAFLTDVTFSNLNVELDVSGAAPIVVLRLPNGEELEVGGAACAFAQSARTRLAVTRRGTRVDVKVDDLPVRACPTALASADRVALGLRGASGLASSGARNLVVRR